MSTNEAQQGNEENNECSKEQIRSVIFTQSIVFDRLNFRTHGFQIGLVIGWNRYHLQLLFIVGVLTRIIEWYHRQ